MKEKLEKTYGSTIKGLFHAINPLKKKFLKTYCTVHKFLCMQALDIMKNDGYEEQYEFFKKYITFINEGVVWADQDFRSCNHFYHFSKKTGLYGFSDALTECKRYYEKSLKFINKRDIKGAMFYLGASCHLIQDTTVPQHVNNKLLKSHRKFELWVISRLLNDYSFLETKGVIRYRQLDDYIRNNAFVANNTYISTMGIKDRNERYKVIACKILKEAQRTSAGFLIDYYDIIKDRL